MILIDPRAGSADLAPALAKLVNCPVKLELLDSADAAFEGNGPNGSSLIGIEVKTLSDLLSCMRNGRYSGDQLPKMLATYEFVALILEGIWRVNDRGLIETWQHGGFQPLNLRNGKQREQGKTDYRYYSEVDSFLTSLELKKQVIVRRASNRVETVRILADLWGWFMRPWDSHKSTDAIKIQVGMPLHKASICQMVAAQLPGIGWQRAAATARHFGSVAAMATASVEDWEAVEGIGPKIARSVHAAIRNFKA